MDSNQNEPGQIFGGVEAVGVDHEVAIGQIDFRRFAPVLAVEELRQGALLDRVDRVVVEPRAGRENKTVFKDCEVCF